MGACHSYRNRGCALFVGTRRFCSRSTGCPAHTAVLGSDVAESLAAPAPTIADHSFVADADLSVPMSTSVLMPASSASPHGWLSQPAIGISQCRRISGFPAFTVRLARSITTSSVHASPGDLLSHFRFGLMVVLRHPLQANRDSDRHDVDPSRR